MEYMDEGVSPTNAYHVVRDDNQKLRWIVEAQGERMEYVKDPNSTWYQRWIAGLIALLPIEEQL